MPPLARDSRPAGQAQQPVLRDTVARLVGQGYDRTVCWGIWQAIVDRTRLSRPDWPWAEADFSDMYDSAARKYDQPGAGAQHRAPGPGAADVWVPPVPLSTLTALPAFPSAL